MGSMIGKGKVGWMDMGGRVLALPCLLLIMGLLGCDVCWRGLHDFSFSGGGGVCVRRYCLFCAAH